MMFISDRPLSGLRRNNVMGAHFPERHRISKAGVSIITARGIRNQVFARA